MEVLSESMRKVIFTGAQGTGKTTILNMFNDDGYPVITEVVRNLAKHGLKINEEGTILTQKIIFDKYKNLLSKNYDGCNEIFSDRGLTDVTAYTAYLANQDHRYEIINLLSEQLNSINDYNINQDCIYFYFPIEFPIVDDGVRSVNEEYRKFINDYIKKILDNLKIKYYIVTGTVRERYNYIKKILNI